MVDVTITHIDRPNIRYQVIAKDDPHNQLKTFLESNHPGDSGIVYRLSRNGVEETVDWLVENGWKALPYHLGLDNETRCRNQERFCCEDGIVIVGTTAFGMGIDKTGVRFVIHLDIPKSLEEYYLQTGLAGMDGLPADAFLTYGPEDVKKLRTLIKSSRTGKRIKCIEDRKLNSMVEYCETTDCRRQVLIDYFSKGHGSDRDNVFYSIVLCMISTIKNFLSAR